MWRLFFLLVKKISGAGPGSKLFYSGVIPEKRYFEPITQEEYDSLVQTQGADQTWSLKDRILKYLGYDLLSLFDVLAAANTRFFLDYHIQMTESNTISKMALELFIVDHYKDNIPLIDNKTLFTEIKQAYYGGCTEVYRPYGENLFYYLRSRSIVYTHLLL